MPSFSVWQKTVCGISRTSAEKAKQIRNLFIIEVPPNWLGNVVFGRITLLPHLRKALCGRKERGLFGGCHTHALPARDKFREKAVMRHAIYIEVPNPHAGDGSVEGSAIGDGFTRFRWTRKS